MRQQFGVGLDGVGKPGLQHLCNLLVVALPCTLQQRLIGRLLNQRMLEELTGLRWHAALIDELRLDEPTQPALQGLLVQWPDGLE